MLKNAIGDRRTRGMNGSLTPRSTVAKVEAARLSRALKVLHYVPTLPTLPPYFGYSLCLLITLPELPNE